MTRHPSLIATVLTLAILGALIASCIFYGPTNTLIGVLFAAAAVAWSRSQ